MQLEWYLVESPNSNFVNSRGIKQEVKATAKERVYKLKT